MSLENKIQKWAAASEMQQLSGTLEEPEDWKKFMGRCNLPRLQLVAPKLKLLEGLLETKLTGNPGCGGLRPTGCYELKILANKEQEQEETRRGANW